MSNAQDFVTSFMTKLAGEATLTSALKDVFAKILAKQVEVAADGTVTFKPAFANLSEIFTFIATPAAERPADPLAYTPAEVDAAKDAAATETGLTLGEEPTEPVEPVVDHYELRAAKAEANEGEANTFTVVAVDVDGNEVAVKEAVSVVFELKIAEGDTASLADFNAGAFNPVTVTIAAGEAVSEPFSVEPISNDGTETTETYTVTATVAGETLTANAKILDGSAGAGQTFVLTNGVDLIPGMNGSNGNAVNSGNDLIVGVEDSTGSNTLNSGDMIDGGQGTDTLRIISDRTAADIPLDNVSNVEIIEVRSSGAVGQVDTSNLDGVTNLNIASATGATSITATAADTTDISVSGAKAAIFVEGGNNVVVNDATADTNITIGGTTVNAGTITVTDTKLGTGVINIDGGTDVTVTASGITTGTINIGQGKAATDLASGAVVVNATGAAFVAATDATLGNITIDGGTTISVTQVATSDASKAAADKTGGTVTQGKVTIVAAATTTDVTVKQDAARGETLAADSTGGATETVSVKFVALVAGDVVELNGLTLTAVEDMTAEDVAAAFANLAANAAIPSDATPTAADGDTQSGAAAAKATYSGSIDGWTSGPAAGDTVVFTNGVENAVPGAALASGAGTSITTGALTLTTLTTGKAHDATPVGGVMGIVAGDVDITGDAALATVTVDGYGVAGNDQIQGTTNTALATVNLSNGGDFDIASAATTLALNLTNVNGTVDVQTGTETLNVDVSGTGTAELKSSVGSGSIKALSVSGSGNVSGTANNTNLGVVDSISTAAMTAGKATFTIDSTATSYTGGAGKDIVTFGNATAATKAIDLGDGNDTLVFAAGSSVPGVVLKGGAGDDTVSLVAANAVTLSASTAFAAQLDSFERLEVTGATGTQDIDLGKLGFTNHVTVAGGAGTLTLTDLANNGTVALTANGGAVVAAIKDAATGAADVLNVQLSNAAALTGGTLTAANVETVNITATDTTIAVGAAADTHTLTLTADKATAVNVSGNAGLTLTLGAATTKLATIDGSDMEGALSVAANGGVAMTITGGSGNDTLSASVGATAKTDVISGGAGNDIIVAGSNGGNGAFLTGGDGNDLFVLTAAAADEGSKDANSYYMITDFQAGDLLQLGWFDITGDATALASSFTKLDTNLNDNTASFDSFVTAAMAQIMAENEADTGFGGTSGTSDALGKAIYFNYKDNAYVVVDSGVSTTGVFTGTEDLVIQLTGINSDNLSFNSDYATVALI